ncbi:protein FAM47A-like [Xyrauchen texanus]|uniref:protein FAM47A-like n=1 Tax=Xyrauchen texanus TaxID=154827 RepID=UPI002241C900|nr:protein FAM47A-like [Xyrauchen texanus]
MDNKMSFNSTPAVNSSFPWYKERLQTKYLRDLSKKQQLSGALDGRRWRFLSPGLDDFRDGYPTVHKELFTQCKCGIYPAVFGMPKHACSVKLPQKRLSKDQACYSKQNPQSQSQREFINAVEHRLKQHPLALYPHLESGMTPEGGKSNDLTESTILDLFKSDYEKKTSLSFPINKTDPDKAPAKLYSSAEEHRKDQSLDICFKELNKDKELQQIHIIQAFREFIISKGQRMPRVIHSSYSVLS